MTEDQLRVSHAERLWRSKYRNPTARRAREEIPALDAEFIRRRLEPPRTPTNFDPEAYGKRLMALPDKALHETLSDVRHVMTTNGRTWLAKRVNQELEIVEMEFQRRALTMPVALRAGISR